MATLLDYAGLLFDYWHDYKRGRLDRPTFIAWMTPLRKHVEALSTCFERPCEHGGRRRAFCTTLTAGALTPATTTARNCVRIGYVEA